MSKSWAESGCRLVSEGTTVPMIRKCTIRVSSFDRSYFKISRCSDAVSFFFFFLFFEEKNFLCVCGHHQWSSSFINVAAASSTARVEIILHLNLSFPFCANCLSLLSWAYGKGDKGIGQEIRVAIVSPHYRWSGDPATVAQLDPLHSRTKRQGWNFRLEYNVSIEERLYRIGDENYEK